MLFYPDQYFYQSQHPRRQASQRQGSRSQSRRQPAFEEVNPWEELFYGAQQPFERYSQPSPRRRASYVPDEYVVVDEDELAALRAYRESKRRQNQEVKRREAEVARRRAEEERRVREAARREAEVRMRAQVEANAKAAAREYFRRKQAQQIALQQAQYAERQQRQQLILEQLRNQFGLFNIQANDEEATQSENAEQAAEPEQDGVAKELREAGSEDKSNERPESESQDAQSQSEARSQSASGEQFDPIRTLIEALAPFPFVITTESSDDEEEPKPAEQEFVAGSEPETPQDKASFESDGEGPTCETASEGSDEPTFVEFIDPSVQPPAVADALSDEEFEQESPSKKDRTKERQAKDPKSRLKKQKHNDRRKTGAEVVGLLHALEDDLSRIRDGYNHISSLPKPTDIKEAVSRVEGIKIGYSRSEEIYNRLDEVRVGKDQRKRKHQITADAVALADKFEELLRTANAVKEELHDKNPSRPESPRHVTLEEVADESD